MIDALLLAVKDSILAQPFGWDKNTCDVLADGHPPTFAGAWYLAVHGGKGRGKMRNARDEYWDYTLTLTRHVEDIPQDKVGTNVLTSRLARTLAKETGFNARAQQLSTFLDSNWAVIALANQYMAEMYASEDFVWGFCEPAVWDDTDDVELVGGDWFGANPNAADAGITAEIRFRDARRLQQIGQFV